MLQILVWGIGIGLIGLGFLILYITKAFPARDIVTKYTCNSCGRVHNGSENLCECGGHFLARQEAEISGTQPGIYKLVAYAFIVAGPLLMLLANGQAASI